MSVAGLWHLKRNEASRFRSDSVSTKRNQNEITAAWN